MRRCRRCRQVPAEHDLSVDILDKRDISSGKKKAKDAAYALAAQLLAAELNFEAGAGTCGAANTAATQAQILLDDINFIGTGNYLKPRPFNPDRATALDLAATLDDYNNNLLCP